MRIALDTNILLYSEGVDGPDKQGVVRRVLSDARRNAELFLSMQACAEFFRALNGKFAWQRTAAQQAVFAWQATAACHALSADGFHNALGLATVHQLQIFDAMILSSAVEAGCLLLLSEDMQHGFTWRGCTIVNPFNLPHHPTLAAMLRTP
jgi:predicted nucleic acid-binding protein